ncbi:MAG: hypothetical protein ABI051_04760 [Vicinamibacterales bacterium]
MTLRVTATILIACVVAWLLAGSRLRVVGDGVEYLAQALNFAVLEKPSVGRKDVARIEAQVAETDPHFANWHIAPSTFPGPDRRRDFIHFWMYALMATPFVWVTRALSLSPLLAFTLLNLILLGVAIAVVRPRIGSAATLLLFASPLIWWIDKAHTEVFTVALLTVSMALLTEKPWWALLAAGLASSQNPPIAVLLPLILAHQLISRPERRRDSRLWVGVAAGVLLAALQPVYALTRHGTVSLLLLGTRPGIPAWSEVSAVVFDPSVGLVGNAPLLLVVALMAAARAARPIPNRVARGEIIVAALSALCFLFAFGRAVNVHHGGTPSLSRYALWLIPLAIPGLHEARERGGRIWRASMAAIAAVSAVISVAYFQPSIGENSREPTALAAWLWVRHPTWSNPLPEVFAETMSRREDPVAPAFTAGCEKVLVLSPGIGGWPIPCYPASVPAFCRVPRTFCYANRQGTTYEWTRAPGRLTAPLEVPTEGRWTRDMEVHIRELYDEWGWPGRDLPSATARLRQGVDVSASLFGTDRRLVAVLQHIGSDARLGVDVAAPAHCALIDASSGATVARFTLADSGAASDPAGNAAGLGSEVPVPAGYDVLVLACTLDPA